MLQHYGLVQHSINSAATDTISLLSAVIQQADAFKWMGVVMIAVALVGVGGQYFPMWGGMFFPARKGYTEEDFYFAEYSAAEREQGLHLASSAFVSPPLLLLLAPDILHLICETHVLRRQDFIMSSCTTQWTLCAS